MLFFKFFIFLLTQITVSECEIGLVIEETRLQTELLRYYNRNVPPNRSVEIDIVMILKNLIDLDIVNEKMIVSGSLLVNWNDSRLELNPMWVEVGLTRMYYKVDEIWRPLLVLSNGADALYVIGDEVDQRSIPIEVSVSGMFWIAPAFFKSICSIDVSMFPFDKQRCELVISSWMFDNETIKFTSSEKEVRASQYKENGEYHLLRTYTEVRDEIAFGKSPWSYAVFGFEFQRRYSYYVINMVVPVLFLEILGVLVFVLPATSGEKLTYALTLLLSLVVMISIVAEKIPSTSVQVPLLSIYILEGVVLSVMQVLLVVYILNLRYWHESGKPLGPVHRVLFKLLRKRDRTSQNKVERLNEEGHNSDNNCGSSMGKSGKMYVDKTENDEACGFNITYGDIAGIVE